MVYHHGESNTGGYYTVDVLREDYREWVRKKNTVVRHHPFSGDYPTLRSAAGECSSITEDLEAESRRVDPDSWIVISKESKKVSKVYNLILV